MAVPSPGVAATPHFQGSPQAISQPAGLFMYLRQLVHAPLRGVLNITTQGALWSLSPQALAFSPLCSLCLLSLFPPQLSLPLSG